MAFDGCDECGFAFDSLAVDEVQERTRTGVAAIVALLRVEPELSLRRLSNDRWSTLEYAAHVRYVMLTIRDRLVIGLVEDNPGFKALYREERVNLGLYATDSPGAVVLELEAAAAMFLRLFAEIDPASLDRQVQYGFPNPTTRSLGWMGKQVVHETEHHLGDMRENSAKLG